MRASDWSRRMLGHPLGLLAFTALTLFYLVMPTFVVVPMSFSSQSFLSFPPPGWSTAVV